MSVFRELYDRFHFWRWDREMGTRRSEHEMWLWDDVRIDNNWEKKIIVFERPKNFSALLVCLKMAESNADAQRLIKSKSIEIRSWTLTPWQQVDLKTMLPTEPTLIRRGKSVYGVKLFWLPVAGVSEKFGDLTLRENWENVR